MCALGKNSLYLIDASGRGIAISNAPAPAPLNSKSSFSKDKKPVEENSVCVQRTPVVSVASAPNGNSAIAYTACVSSVML